MVWASRTASQAGRPPFGVGRVGTSAIVRTRGCPIVLARLARRVGRFMFTLFSTPCSLPSALSFLAVTGLGHVRIPSFLFDPHRCAKMEYGPARVVPAVPAWSGACPRRRGVPAWSGACPRRRGLPAWEGLPAGSLEGVQDMVTAPSLALACSPQWACPHSRLLIPLFRFLTSDFQFPLASALSTINCLLSRLESAFIRIGPIRPRKSFGMREIVKKVAQIRVHKRFRICFLRMRAFVTPLECAATKTRGGGPSLCQMVEVLRGPLGRPGGSGAWGIGRGATPGQAGLQPRSWLAPLRRGWHAGRATRR